MLVLSILLLCCFTARERPNPFATALAATSQQLIEPQAIKIRNATHADVDAITDILVDAWAPAAEQKYIYQFRDKYPSYHWKCMQEAVDQALEFQGQGVFINVVDALVSGDSEEVKAVAVAIWVLMTRNAESYSVPPLTPFKMLDLNSNCSKHLDMNETRAIHWAKQFSRYKRDYIDEAYDRQVYLSLLGTHPDYDGRGFGAAHCQWGKALARERGENTTLIATPAGYELYKTIEFDSLANLTFTKVGGSFLTWFEVMMSNGMA
jgi:GNAT superfamily N-acetyltransferase